MKNIVVIGGYGQVGSVICKNLSQKYPQKVIAAGRNIDKATIFSLSTKGKVLPMSLDIYNLDATHEIFNNTELVIMCLAQKDTSFVEKCIQNNIDYLDISPSYNILSKIESLHPKVLQSESTLVLGVGLAPGLTNLMVKKIVSYFDKVNSTDIFLMLGIGEKHGKDGVEWLLNNINNNYSIYENGQKRNVECFTEGKYVELPKKYGKRKAYRFDLADQHIVSKTLELTNVSSRLFYDSVFTTKELAVLKKIGLFRLLKYNLMKKLFVIAFDKALHIFEKLKVGTNDYLIKVEVTGDIGGTEETMESVLYGSNNTQMTGLVAAIIGSKLIHNKYSSGVHYLEQLFDLEDILSSLDDEILYNFKGKTSTNIGQLQ